MIAFECSSCGRALKVKDELAGKKVKCPGCQKPVAVPQSAASLSPQPAAPPARGEERTLPPKDQSPERSADPGGVTNLGDGRYAATQSIPGPQPSRTVILDEDARRRFEAAWQARKPVPIETFLADKPVTHLLATLEELVHIELEYQRKSWSEKVDNANRLRWSRRTWRASRN